MTAYSIPRLQRKTAGALRQAAMHLPLIVLSFVAVFPLVWMLMSSFKNSAEIYGAALFPAHFTLENYVYAFTQMPILRMMANSFVVALIMVAVQLAVAIMTAYALVRWDFKGKGFLYGLLSLTWIVPAQATMVPNYVQICTWGLRGTLPAIFLPFMVSVFACISLNQSFAAFPRALIEAARIDGAGEFTLMTRILLPNMRSSIASLAIFQFITAWSEYIWSSLVTNGLENAPIQIGLKSFIGSDTNMWGSLMASTVVSCLPILVLYALMQRNIINSFMKWGIK